LQIGENLPRGGKSNVLLEFELRAPVSHLFGCRMEPQEALPIYFTSLQVLVDILRRKRSDERSRQLTWASFRSTGFMAFCHPIFCKVFKV